LATAPTSFHPRAKNTGDQLIWLDPSVDVQVEGSTLAIRIPIRFQRRGGRKRIVAPDGSAIVPTSKPQPDGTLIKALARAWRWQRQLDEGV
jgi:hypothetical protein